MSQTLESAIADLPIAAPTLPEPPREGDPGGDACHYCAATDEDAVWSTSSWRVLPRSWSPVPGGVLLISSEHVDTLSELPAEQQAEFGTLAANIERAIMSLGTAARVHMNRWGDGCAHFHVHFIPRPLGYPQFGWRNLALLEKRFPGPGPDELAAAHHKVGAYLQAASSPVS